MNMQRGWLGIAAVTTAFLMLGGIATAGQNTQTGFFVAGAPKKGTIEGVINVCEQGQNECIGDGSVKVKLFKRVDGAWSKVAAKQATADGNTWTIKFTGAPRGGTCKMLAIFSGTAQYEPSRGSTKGKCTDQTW